MNKLNGKVISVTTGDPYETYEILLPTGCSIAGILPSKDTGQPYRPVDAVGINFDEMDVFLAKYFSEDTTVRKRFTAIVSSVELGEALTRIMLDYQGCLITAVVRTSSWNSLGLEVGNEVLWLIKATKVTVGPP